MINNILNIYDEQHNEIKFNKLEIKLQKTPKSSVYSKILFIDDIPIIGKLRKLYRVKFKCNCGNISETYLRSYLSKKYIQCNKCTSHNFINKNQKEKIEKDFFKYDIDFQNNYWKRHLHKEEFYNFITKIYSINGKKFNIDNIIFYEHEPSNNQSKFVSKISFDNGKSKENLISLELQCNICKKIFKIKPFNLRRKNINDIRCQYCNFETIKFKLQKYKDTDLTYQSNLEKYFLDKCFTYNINVINGFEIPYYYDNKLKTYITDFYLPDFKMIIEIKGNNPWYRKDLNNGKLEAKNNYAIQFAKNHGMKFEFILDDIDNFFEKIIK